MKIMFVSDIHGKSNYLLPRLMYSGNSHPVPDFSAYSSGGYWAIWGIGGNKDEWGFHARPCMLDIVNYRGPDFFSQR